MKIFDQAHFIKSTGGGFGGKKLLDTTLDSFGGLAGAGQKFPAAGADLGENIIDAALAMNNQNHAFSYLYPVISPNGLYERISEDNVQYYEGAMLGNAHPSDPIYQSLGSAKCHNPSITKIPKMARLTKNGGFHSYITGDYADEQDFGSQIYAGEVYNLLSSYRNHGLEKISFSNKIKVPFVRDEKGKYFQGLLGAAHKEYVFLYGNTSKTSGLPGPINEQFAKLKLVFLSLMMSIKQKKEGFIYRYPTYNPLKPNASNTKVLHPKYVASEFSFDNLIDSNNEFLKEITDSNGSFARELYAIAYQLMIGKSQADGAVQTIYSEGIENKTFYNAKAQSRIPVSEEVSPVLATLGDLEISDMVADIKPTYNYTIPYFEKAAPQIPEIRLPNIYQSLITDGLDNFGEMYKANTYSLGSPSPYEENYNQNPEDDDDYSYNDSIYENIANSFIICGEKESSVYLKKKFTNLMNIVLDANFFHDNPMHEQAELLKNQLPAYVEIKFQTEQCNKMTVKFLKTLADSYTIQHYIQTYIHHGGPSANAHSIIDEKTFGLGGPSTTTNDIKKSYSFLDEYRIYEPLTYQYVTSLKDPSEINLFDPDSIRSIIADSLTGNFGRWFELYCHCTSDTNSKTQGKWLIPNPKSVNSIVNPYELFDNRKNGSSKVQYLMYSDGFSTLGNLHQHPSVVEQRMSVVQPEVRQMTEDSTIGYRLHNKGTNVGNATLFYEIKKFDTKGNNIQNIFVQNNPPDNGGKKTIKYIDTQVKYGEKYTYEIVAHKLLFSSDYKITFENTKATDAMADSLGYGVKKPYDRIYTAIKDFNGNKVGDYYNTPIYNPFTGPTYAQLGGQVPSAAAVSSVIEALAEPLGYSFEPGSTSTEDLTSETFFDLDNSVQGVGAITGIGDSPAEQLLTAGLLNPFTEGVSFTTYRAYTQTDAFPSQTKTLFGSDEENESFSAATSEISDFLEGETKAILDNHGFRKGPISHAGQGGGFSLGDASIPIDPAEMQFFRGPGGGSPGGAVGTSNQSDLCEDVIDSTLFVDDPTGVVLADPNEKLFIFEVKTFPNPIVSKIPFYTENNVVVMDDPPIYPNVNFCPFAKEKRKLMITFENQGGMKEEAPINLMPQDNAIFNHVRQSQKRGYQYEDGTFIDDTLRFKNDDFASEYQVFRITKEPSSYDDFFGQLYKTLNVSQETAYNEMLETNVKYYYVFRTIDKHSKVSNPTPVYQVEMVEDGGLVYPVINIFEMSGKNKLNKVKSFDRFLKIEAAYAQKILNLEKSKIDPSGEFHENFAPELGILDESLWNQKKFKFRIKAKNSCKAIDLNINFVTKHTDTDNGPKTCN